MEIQSLIIMLSFVCVCVCVCDYLRIKVLAENQTKAHLYVIYKMTIMFSPLCWQRSTIVLYLLIWIHCWFDFFSKKIYFKRNNLSGLFIGAIIQLLQPCEGLRCPRTFSNLFLQQFVFNMKSVNHHLLVGNSKFLTTTRKADSHWFGAENKTTGLISKVFFPLDFCTKQLVSFQPSKQYS